MTPADRQAFAAYLRRIHKIFLVYVVCVLLFLAVMALAERAGLSRTWIGGLFLTASILLYTAIGLYCRTSDADEYFVAGRRVPALYNGMATAADWMSAASFISLAGGLYLQGFAGSPSQPGGLAYILGWTGGFCLLALLVAPYLRGLQIYTVPDYFHIRYGGVWPRRLAAMAAAVCSFTYVVAQIYGVGLIATRLTGVRFEIGILLGLSGVLVCSFLGGMRAVTWTQVAQYVILLLAFLIPVSWLAYKQLGSPLAVWVYGQQLDKIASLEEQVLNSPAESAVINAYKRKAQQLEVKLQDVDAALAQERQRALERLQNLKAERAEASVIFAAGRELAAIPKDAETARDSWQKARQENIQRAQPLAGMPRHAQAFAGDPEGTAAERMAFEQSRANFLALMFCLMVGTMGLPHLLIRFFTTTSVAQTRSSVAWSLFFIAILYLSAPAMAVLVKYEVLHNLVGHPFHELPAWIAQWSKVDPALLSVQDVNGDGVLQFAELHMEADIVMLAMPELSGLPYVISGLVAAGGLAAALSTADGLLLTMGNALSHDLLFREQTRSTRPVRLVILSKFVLLIMALVAAYVAAQKPANILNLVAASFSLAGSAFVPAMVCGIFWRRVSARAAVTGMLGGLGLTLFYMSLFAPWGRGLHLALGQPALWGGIQPISSGVFGVPFGFALIVGVTLGEQALAWRPGRRAVRADGQSRL